MGNVVAVLLVPEEGDPHGLLKEGPCGARPPMAHLQESSLRRWTEGYPGAWVSTFAGKPVSSLVLAWDGEPVAEGLLRVSSKRPDIYHRNLLRAYRLLGGAAPLGAFSDLGTVVLLDADGREVTHG